MRTSSDSRARAAVIAGLAREGAALIVLVAFCAVVIAWAERFA